METKQKSCMSGSTIKLIAMGSMLIDHIGAAALFPAVAKGTVLYELCRLAGRIAFPLFCFLLVEGFVHTHSRRHYLLRLFLFAVLSEIPFDLVFYHRIVCLQMQNIFFTLFLGFLALCGMEWMQRKQYGRMALLFPLLSGIAAEILRTDYSFYGILLITVLYVFRGVPWKRNLAAAALCIWEMTAVLALIPMQLYNGKRGLPLKYVFYMVYPLHLLLFWYLRQLIY